MPTMPTTCGPLTYDVSGDGPPLLFLHAAAHDHHDLDAVRGRLDKAFRVYAVDWPAHGDSPAPVEGWSVSAPAFADLAAEVVGQIAAIEGRPVALLGNSVGGFAAARVALDHPDAVSAVVLVDSGGFIRRSPLAHGFCRAMAWPRLLSRLYPAFCARYLRARTPFDEAIHERAATAMRNDPARIAVVARLWGSFTSPAHDLRRDAPSLTVPALVVWGRRDPVIPLSSGRRAARLLGCELVVLDTGHVPFSSRPDEFADAVVPFLVAATAIVDDTTSDESIDSDDDLPEAAPLTPTGTDGPRA